MRPTFHTIAAALFLFAACEREPAAPADEMPRAKATVAPAAASAEGQVAPVAATYVGRAVCAECHAAEVEAHAGSHHDRALEAATRDAVRAPFAGEKLGADHVSARFRQQEGRFVIEAEGRAWPVKWTLGVEPLQQYLVEADDGRVQAFPAPFDTRAPAQGGGHWYMQPDLDVPAGDALHWQGLAMSWNATCADCHSTHLEKRYQLTEDRYDTRFAEPDVSCEACHGPASRHVVFARRGKESVAEQANGGFERALLHPPTRRWVRAEGEPIAHLEGVGTSPRGPLHATDQLDACARCHARRSDLGGDSLRFHDRYRLEWLDEPLYFADGQIRDEVYVYGSFLQSKMARAGVTCSDCHDPHTARLRAEPEQVCAQCHDPARYAEPSHHLHEEPGTAPTCVDCHMPERTYMGVDGRRDHRLGVPRPDLSDALGTPNACRGCHDTRDNAWLAAAIARGHGSTRPPSPWPALHALRTAPDGAAVQAVAALVQDASQAPVVRASALVSWSRAAPTEAFRQALVRAAGSVEPLLRRAAAEASRALPPAPRRAVLAPLWKDPRRTVRLAAALAHLDAGATAAAGPPAFVAALGEARQAQEFNADTPQGLLGLAAVELGFGNRERALALLERAATRFAYDPATFANWADALRATGDEARAGQVLQQGLKAHPDSGPLHHARGLWLVRNDRRNESLTELARAVELADPADRPRFEYVYEVARRQLGAQADDSP